MKIFLEDVLRMNIEIKEDNKIYNKLPLLFKGKYYIYNVNSNGAVWIAIQPRDVVRLPQLRRDRALVEKKAGLNCAIFLENTTFYSREKMKEEGIPFVLKNKDVYLPFLGILLSGDKQRELKPVHQISFLTQKILLTGLYESYSKATVSQISQQLGVSKMAVSKSFDEIEYLEIDVMDKKGKSRAITMNGSHKESWDRISSFLRGPVIRKFILEEDICLDKKAGISALSEYSLLDDNVYPTYAILKSEVSDSKIKYHKEVARGGEIGCVVLELGYFIDSIKNNVQDPLSVLLSVKDELDDERVEASVEEMLKEYVW